MHLGLHDTLSQKAKSVQTSKREARVRKDRLLKGKRIKTSGITKERLEQLKSAERQKGYPSKSSKLQMLQHQFHGGGMRNEEKPLKMWLYKCNMSLTKKDGHPT